MHITRPPSASTPQTCPHPPSQHAPFNPAKQHHKGRSLVPSPFRSSILPSLRARSECTTPASTRQRTTTENSNQSTREQRSHREAQSNRAKGGGGDPGGVGGTHTHGRRQLSSTARVAPWSQRWCEICYKA